MLSGRIYKRLEKALRGGKNGTYTISVRPKVMSVNLT
jgi:hypothetical protein